MSSYLKILKDFFKLLFYIACHIYCWSQVSDYSNYYHLQAVTLSYNLNVGVRHSTNTIKFVFIYFYSVTYMSLFGSRYVCHIINLVQNLILVVVEQGQDTYSPEGRYILLDEFNWPICYIVIFVLILLELQLYYFIRLLRFCVVWQQTIF